MGKHYSLIIGLILGSTSVTGFSQIDSTSNQFLRGQVYGRIFTNFHSGLTKADPSKAFEVRRAYFGYETSMNNNFSAEVKLDIGSPNDLSEYSRIRRYAYFKTAAFFHTTERTYFKFGIIDIDMFALQEKYWGHRYVERSFMDHHRFGDKADLGASFHYQLFDFLAADITLMNGEGYRNLQRDNAFKSGLGLSIYPFNNLLIRVFGDYTRKGEEQMTLVTFLGYRTEIITAGFEYNYKFNKDFQLHHDQMGVSTYMSYQLNDKFEFLGRYDVLSSNFLAEEETPWNLSNDGSSLMVGIEYQVVDGLKAALNYRDWVPSAANLANRSYIYLNFEIRL